MDLGTLPATGWFDPEVVTPLVPAPEWMPRWLGRWFELVPPWLADLVLAILVLGIGYLVSRAVVQLMGRRIAQRFRRPSLTRAALRGIRVGVFLFAFLTVLRIYGLELGDIALSVTVFSAVVGVVLAPIVGSIISGVFLLADQPYEIGDMIELAEQNKRGFVEDITLRYTKIFTLDNTFLVNPNGSMRDRDVVNYSAEDTRTRQSLGILVTYESDVPRARTLIEEAAREVDRVVEGGPPIRVGAARYPAGPTCYIDEYADDGILLTLRYWIEEPYWLLRVRSKIQERLNETMADEDVEIAYPHTHHVFDDTSGRMRVGLDDDATRSTLAPDDAVADRRESPVDPEPAPGDGSEDSTGQPPETRDPEE